jgi:hypothetical protein
MKANIKMSSDLYGEETFPYESIKEAKQGFSRLIKAIQQRKDQVERELVLEGSNGKVYKEVKVLSSTLVEVIV